VDAGFSRDHVFHGQCRRRRRRHALGSAGPRWSLATNRDRNQWWRPESRRQATRGLSARRRPHGAEHPHPRSLSAHSENTAAIGFHLSQPTVVARRSLDRISAIRPR
jgi:hypothetical protein